MTNEMLYHYFHIMLRLLNCHSLIFNVIMFFFNFKNYPHPFLQPNKVVQSSITTQATTSNCCCHPCDHHCLRFVGYRFQHQHHRCVHPNHHCNCAQHPLHYIRFTLHEHTHPTQSRALGLTTTSDLCRMTTATLHKVVHRTPTLSIDPQDFRS